MKVDLVDIGADALYRIRDGAETVRVLSEGEAVALNAELERLLAELGLPDPVLAYRTPAEIELDRIHERRRREDAERATSS